MNILVIEDDFQIGKAVQKGLSEAGHEVAWQRDGQKGFAQARTHNCDAIVLDLLLPGDSGLDILRKLREEGFNTPIVAVSALGATDNKVAGLRNGADDYLVMPFDIAELLARIDAVKRRSTLKPALTLHAGQLVLDMTTRRVSSGGVTVDLTPTEFSILEILMRYVGLVVTRKMICENLWESDWEGTTNVIEVHINRLRNKLQKGVKEPLIHTVRGRGYALRANSIP